MKYSYRTLWSPVARVTVLVLVFMVLAGTAWAGGSGSCHSVTVSSEIVLPDGSVHAPGALTSCAQRTHSPTSTLLELSIDGHPIHMVIARSDRSEPEVEVQDALFCCQGLRLAVYLVQPDRLHRQVGVHNSACRAPDAI